MIPDRVPIKLHRRGWDALHGMQSSTVRMIRVAQALYIKVIILNSMDKQTVDNLYVALTENQTRI